ncbi:MAG: hypothetical protein LBQ87_06735 [Candidatus Fibromonas sp.]|jgi:hypothetical protein|nr:hypothetical protein [Candidatus Fibromonas sp.]
MQAVEFETEIVNDTICIPQEYKGNLPHKARVIIMDSIFSNPYIVHTRKKGTITSNDFKSIKINTSNFRFNREEANER